MEVVEDFGAMSAPDLPYTHSVVVRVPQHLRDSMSIDVEENRLVLSCVPSAEPISWTLPFYPSSEDISVSAKYKKRTSVLTIRLALPSPPPLPPPSSPSPPPPSPSSLSVPRISSSNGGGCMKMAQEVLPGGIFEDLIEALQVRVGG